MAGMRLTPGRAVRARRRAAAVLNACVQPLGLAVIPAASLTEAQRRAGAPRRDGAGVDERDRRELTPTNPRLLELSRRYRAAGSAGGGNASALWRPGYVRPADLLFFRGDNPYVHQCVGGAGPEQHLLTWLYLKGWDHLRLLDRLREDGDYGVCASPTGEADPGGRPCLVSRDLLDSVCELLFLDRALGLPTGASKGAGVLDIGAGYGRLAYRATSAFPALSAWYCVDAVPESTFLCEYYLDRKGIAGRARAVPLDELGRLPGEGAIELAVAVHSMSEFPPAAVDFWAGLCARLEVRYLFVVPNGSARGGGALHFSYGNRDDFRPMLEAHGYRLQHAEPKYANPEVQKHGITPAWYYLFELGSPGDGSSAAAGSAGRRRRAMSGAPSRGRRPTPGRYVAARSAGRQADPGKPLRS
jgi:SAM-dependent methyltransferase